MTPSGMNVQTGPSYAPPPPQAEALRDPDPGNIFFLPAARTLPKGKFNIAVGRPIVAGVYYGVNNCFTIGIGGSPTASVQLEVKWSLIKLLRHTVSLWGFFHYPFAMVVYQTEESEDFEDGGLMYAGGFLYAFESAKVDLKLGLIYYGFPMYDKYKRCRGLECEKETNWYHRWIITSPYVEAAYRVAKRVKIFGLLTSFQIRSIAIHKTSVDNEVKVREAKSFFWEDMMIAVGVRYFRKRFAIDAGFIVPIIPSLWGGDGYPYVFPMIGASWIR